jgi:hypothetical protein
VSGGRHVVRLAAHGGMRRVRPAHLGRVACGSGKATRGGAASACAEGPCPCVTKRRGRRRRRRRRRGVATAQGRRDVTCRVRGPGSRQRGTHQCV